MCLQLLRDGIILVLTPLWIQTLPEETYDSQIQTLLEETDGFQNITTLPEDNLQIVTF